MDGIDFVGYLVDGFLERADVCGRGRDSVERQISSLVESIEAKDYRRLKDVLPVVSNKGSRWVFEQVTGIRLKRTWKGAMEQIREYCGDLYREYEEERDRAAKEREDEKERERMEHDARLHEYLHGYEEVVGRLQAGRLVKLLEARIMGLDGKPTTIHDFIDGDLDRLSVYCENYEGGEIYCYIDKNKPMDMKIRSVIQYIAWRIGRARCRWHCYACRHINGGCPLEEKKIEVLR